MSPNGRRFSGARNMGDCFRSSNGSIPRTFLCATGVLGENWYCSHRLFVVFFLLAMWILLVFFSYLRNSMPTRRTRSG
jgi:hypothetical protein